MECGMRPGFGKGLLLLRMSSVAGLRVGLLLRKTYSLPEHEFSSSEAISQLPHLVARLGPGGERRSRFKAVVVLRMLLQVCDESGLLLQHGAVPPLLRIVSEERDEPALRFETVRVLANFCVSAPEHVGALLDQGAIPVLLQAAREGDIDVCDRSATTISNIAECSATHRDRLLEAGTMDLMLSLVREHRTAPHSPALVSCVEALGSLLRESPLPAPEARFVEPVVSVLCDLALHSEDGEVKEYALRGLANAAKITSDAQILLDAGALPLALSFVGASGKSVRSAARVLAGVARTGEGSREIVAAGALPKLLHIIDNPSSTDDVLAEVCWAVTKVAAKEPEAVLNAGLAESVTRLLAEDVPQKLREKATAVIAVILAAEEVGDVRAIAGQGIDAIDARDEYVRVGVLDAILVLAEERAKKKDALPVLRVCAWAIAGILYGKPPPDVLVQRSTVPTLCGLLKDCDDVEVQEAALRGLDRVGGGNAINARCLLDAGAVPLAIPFVRSSFSLASTAVRVIGSVARGPTCRHVVRAGALPALKAVVEDAESSWDLVGTAAWVVSNVAAGDAEMRAAVLDAGLVQSCVDLLVRPEVPEDVREDAGWVLLNVQEDTSTAAAVGEQGGHLGCFSALCSPEQYKHSIKEYRWMASGFRDVLDAGQRTVYLRHAGAELTDASALLADCGICAESVVELVSTEDGFDSVQWSTEQQLPVFVVAGEHRVPVDVPCSGTVRDLVGAAAAACRSLGWRICRQPRDRNRFVRELLSTSDGAGGKLAEVMDSVREHHPDAAGVLQLVLDEHFAA
eukprot:TRINITY_DN3315_c0_g2_i1.p1 TRINITY_DN3315_c0_g2~~TRINITY_DN3315_c0_g2_i1.p1  ORF type:complete len:822 (+),score=220.39 TRINITY_DN3315_c0_g2_i1:71-2467(+)